MKRWITKHPKSTQWILCGFVTFIFLILQTTPGLFSFGPYKLSLLLPFAISIAIFSDQLPAAVFGAVVGILWDISSGRLVGFGGLILFIMCFLVSLSFSLYFRPTAKMCGLSCMVCMFIYLFIDYFFYYLTSSPSGWLRYLVLHVGITSLVTFIIGASMFWMCKHLCSIGNKDPEY